MTATGSVDLLKRLHLFDDIPLAQVVACLGGGRACRGSAVGQKGPQIIDFWVEIAACFL